MGAGLRENARWSLQDWRRNNQGKPQQARELLAAIYNWFNEGFYTRDLKETKALLDE
jgi:hypothetical protein